MAITTEGIYHYEEGDTGPDFSSLLNKLAESVAARLKGDEWQPLTLPSGWESNGAGVRRIGDVVHFKGSITKSTPIVQNSGGELAFTLPSGYYLPIESGRIPTSGFGSATPNGVNIVISKSSTSVNAFLSGGFQNTVYLSGVSYMAG